MSALPPDYDLDPERSRSFLAGWQEDVHAPVAQRLASMGARTVVDVGCGTGRLAAALGGSASWIGIDSSPRQLRDSPHRPVIRADAVALPLGTATADAATMLWMLYHLDEPRTALAEARRILRRGGLLAACTSSRRNDPELVPEGYPATSFDAEEAADVVAEVFGASNVEVQRWDEPLVELRDRAQVAAYARSHLLAPEVAERVQPPITLTKRGCLVWAQRS